MLLLKLQIAATSNEIIIKKMNVTCAYLSFIYVNYGTSHRFCITSSWELVSGRKAGSYYHSLSLKIHYREVHLPGIKEEFYILSLPPSSCQ
jgi:hypothetical protein